MYIKFDCNNDRFFLSKIPLVGNDFDKVIDLNHFEYLRYVPLNGLTLEELDLFLARNPCEVCIEITNKCNFLCPICIADARKKNGKFISHKILFRLLESLPDTIKKITITGGEPTLHPELERILELCLEKFGCVYLSTNGFFYEKIAKILTDYQICLAISLHGPTAIHDDYVGKKGAFLMAIKTLEFALNNHINTYIYSVLTEYNYLYLPELIEMLNRFSFSEHRLYMVKSRGRVEKDPVKFDDILSIINKISPRNRTTIKKREYPFLLINFNGEVVLRNV